jgi:AcrR family transcriptional regulator
MSDKKTTSLAAALDVAADVFSRHPFTEVKVADIARRAHCSTTTIYEVYGGKEGLFIAAMRHLIGRAQAREAVWPGAPIEVLLAAAESHARFMGSRTSRKTFRNVFAAVGGEGAHAAVAVALRQRFAGLFGDFRSAVEACLASDDLCPFAPGAIVEHILAGTIWRPLLLAMMFGDDEPVGMSYPDLVAQVMGPLVTEKGALAVGAYLARSSVN